MEAQADAPAWDVRRGRVRSSLALGGALLGAFAVVGAVVALASDRSPSIGRNVLVNRPGVMDAYNSPSVARNPTRPENVVVTHRVDRPSFSALIQWSLEGGPRGSRRPSRCPRARTGRSLPTWPSAPTGSSTWHTST